LVLEPGLLPVCGAELALLTVLEWYDGLVLC
jgi:hypothetical protein